MRDEVKRLIAYLRWRWSRKIIYFADADGMMTRILVTHKRSLKLDWFGRNCFAVRLAENGEVINNNPTLRGYGKPCDWLKWEYER